MARQVAVAHEWIGQAADKAEALQSAEKADPRRVDLEWMRVRYERDLNVRQLGSRFAPTRTYRAIFSQPTLMKPGSLQTGEECFPLDGR